MPENVLHSVTGLPQPKIEAENIYEHLARRSLGFSSVHDSSLSIIQIYVRLSSHVFGVGGEGIKAREQGLLLGLCIQRNGGDPPRAGREGDIRGSGCGHHDYMGEEPHLST